MAEFSLRNCKQIAESIEVPVTKVTDAAHDAFCKVAALMIDDSKLARELLAAAQVFVASAREANEPWKLHEIRDLRRRRRELELFRAEVEREEHTGETPVPHRSRTAGTEPGRYRS